MDSWKSRGGKSQRGEVKKWEDQRRKKMQVREKVGKSRFTVFFQWFGAPEGRKVGLLKRRVRSQLARWEMKNCTPLWHTMFGPLLEIEMSKKCTLFWREARFQVKMYKAHHDRTAFGNWDVEKVYAVLARSTFPRQNVQNTPCSDPFWKLRCRKSVRRSGTKHIFKSKCTRHTNCGPLLEVDMSNKMYAVVARSTFPSQNVQIKHTRFSALLEVERLKKCTPLWHEAHFQVKMYKAHQFQRTFGSGEVEKVDVVVARSAFPTQKCKKLRVRTTFGPSDVVLRRRRKGWCTLSLSKLGKNVRVL